MKTGAGAGRENHAGDANVAGPDGPGGPDDRHAPATAMPAGRHKTLPTPPIAGVMKRALSLLEPASASQASRVETLRKTRTMSEQPPPAIHDSVASADAWRLVDHLAPYLRIAHHIAGRIRLKLDAAALADRRVSAGSASQLKALPAGVRGIRRVELNLIARSCIIEYDAAIIPDAAWPDLLGGRDTPAAAVLMSVLRDHDAGRRKPRQ